MIKLVEPIWSVNLSKALFAWMQASTFLSHRMPILADIFVFTYPVYLVALYVYGMVKMLKRWNVERLKQGIQYKISAIFIFIGTLLTAIVNIVIQFFMDKVRPDVVLGVADLKTPSILHKFLPSASFPSDHAAISMGIAFSSIVWWVKNKDKKYMRFGVILIVFSLITSFARLTSAIHWLTDIIAGSVIGIVVPWILMNKKIYAIIGRFWTRIGKII